jgi:Ankyrin repeats (3 copies)/Zinc finger, C3HC4 type (RING finger)
VTASNSPVRVEVTDDSSCYSLASGLRVNLREPLEQFYDDFVRLSENVYDQYPMHLKHDNNSILISEGRAKVENHTRISFDRTLRVPEDGTLYGMPALFGPFPIVYVDRLKAHNLDNIRCKGGLLIPLYQREALVLSFNPDREANKYCSSWNSASDINFAIRVLCGSVNALTGCAATKDTSQPLQRQDYVVAPRQVRLDGFLTEKNLVHQFVAMPLGSGYTVEGQITGEESIGGIQLVIAPKFRGRGEFIGCDRQCASPEELGLKVGDGLLMTGEHVLARTRSFKLSTQEYPLLRNENFYPSPSYGKRPTFVHELLRFAGQSRQAEHVFDLEAVQPLKLHTAWTQCPSRSANRFRDIYYSPPSQFDAPEIEISPFMDISSFEWTVLGSRGYNVGWVSINDISLEVKKDEYQPLWEVAKSGDLVDCRGFWNEPCIGAAGAYLRDVFRRRPGKRSWELGLCVGGGINQEIRQDPDPNIWNWHKAKVINIQIISAPLFQALTGQPPPPSPITYQSYIDARLPFYHVVPRESVEVGEGLSSVLTVSNLDARHGPAKGIVLRQDQKPVECVVCGKYLTDSVLRACNHVFCSACIETMKTGETIYCGACNSPVTEVIRFSAPMETTHTRVPSAGTDEVTKSLDSERSSDGSTLVSGVAECVAFSEQEDDEQQPENSQTSTEVSSESQENLTYLDELVATGDVETFRRLLKISPSPAVTMTPLEGLSTLQRAAQQGNVAIVDVLLQHGFDVNEPPAPKDGRTALQAAAGAGHLDVCKRLLHVGANVNAPPCEEGGRSALDAAIEAGHVHIFDLLLDHGARVSHLAGMRSPLHYAANLGRLNFCID